MSSASDPSSSRTQKFATWSSSSEQACFSLKKASSRRSKEKLSSQLTGSNAGCHIKMGTVVGDTEFELAGVAELELEPVSELD